MADIFLTKEGREEKEKYLDYLKSERRQEVVEKLKAAREFGDLSENSEYDAARDEQRKLEAEIEKIEEMGVDVISMLQYDLDWGNYGFKKINATDY